MDDQPCGPQIHGRDAKDVAAFQLSKQAEDGRITVGTGSILMGRASWRRAWLLSPFTGRVSVNDAPSQASAQSKLHAALT
jgi:hypothetical protein